MTLKETNAFVAYYQPTSKEEHSRICKTKKEAEKYIISKCCKDCKKEGMASACAAEWLIIPYSKYLKAENHFDLMKAAGYKQIKKPLK